MNFFRKLWNRIRFTLHPLSEEAENLLRQVAHGEVTGLDNMPIWQLPALIELVDRGMVTFEDTDGNFDKIP